MYFYCSSHIIFSRSACWRPSCPGEGWTCVAWQQTTEESFCALLISTHMRMRKKRRKISSMCPAKWVSTCCILRIFRLYFHVLHSEPVKTQRTAVNLLHNWFIFSFLVLQCFYVRVYCWQCLGQDVNVLIDTGCRLNIMSSRTVDRLGWDHHLYIWHTLGHFQYSINHFLNFSQSLKDLVEETKLESDGFPFQRKLCIDGHIRELSLTVGQLRIMCSFVIVGKEEEED